MKRIIVIVVVILLFSMQVSAHPGKTDSSGCHTCRTNCAKWGYRTGEYHCHYSGPAKTDPITTTTTPVTTAAVTTTASVTTAFTTTSSLKLDKTSTNTNVTSTSRLNTEINELTTSFKSESTTVQALIQSQELNHYLNQESERNHLWGLISLPVGIGSVSVWLLFNKISRKNKNRR